jgi:hypothetical protein
MSLLVELAAFVKAGESAWSDSDVLRPCQGFGSLSLMAVDPYIQVCNKPTIVGIKPLVVIEYLPWATSQSREASS